MKIRACFLTRSAFIWNCGSSLANYSPELGAAQLPGNGRGPRLQHSCMQSAPGAEVEFTDMGLYQMTGSAQCCCSVLLSLQGLSQSQIRQTDNTSQKTSGLLGLAVAYIGLIVLN